MALTKCYVFSFFILNLVWNTMEDCISRCDNHEQILNPDCYIGYCNTAYVIQYLCKVTCENVSLTDHWQDSSSKSYDTCCGNVATTSELEIAISNTKTLHMNTFSNYPDLKLLKMINSNVSDILPGAFLQLNKLTELNLTHNHINNIKSGVLNNLVLLVTLDLSFNEIAVLDNHAFYGLKLLERILLNSNRITEINFDIFQSFTSLKFVDLSHNKIYMIEAEMSTTTSLKELDLGFNMLTNISNLCDSVLHLDVLTILKLDYNNLEEYEKCLTANNLEKLSLSSVGLSDMNFLENTPYNKLVELDLSSNNISTIDHLLTNLTLLENLNLSSNFIVDLPLGCFTNLHQLKTLILSFNNIEELQMGVFQDLYQLEFLDLSFNKLKSLYEYCFYALKNLKSLKVNNNHIAVIDVDKITRGKTLTQISLENNNWKCDVLAETIIKFEKHNISVTASIARQQKNVHGITCNDNDETETTRALEILTKPNGTFSNIQVRPPNLTDLRIFDENFKKTAFFKLFNTSNLYSKNLGDFDKSFTNTIFYKFFNEKLLGNNFSGVFARFDRAFVNSVLYKSLKYDFLKNKLEELEVKNFSSVEKNSTSTVSRDGEKDLQFYKYLDEGFRNSNFYKYFEEFSAPTSSNVVVNPEKLIGEDEMFKSFFNAVKGMFVVVIAIGIILVFVQIYVNKSKFGFFNWGKVKNVESRRCLNDNNVEML